MSLDRLQLLCANLGSVAERRAVTYLDADDILALRDVGAIELYPATGRPESCVFGADLLLLDHVSEGLYRVTGEHYAEYRLSAPPEMDTFAADAAAEGVF